MLDANKYNTQRAIMIQFICASNNEEVLQANLLRSPIFKIYPLTIQNGYTNISKAYNDAQAEVEAERIVYVHQDVFLPKYYEVDLWICLGELITNFGDWGVLGVAGTKLVSGKKEHYGYLKDRGKQWGSPSKLPHEVDTLDELLIITHGDFTFDENLDLDFYGADICMQAKQQGRKCYAINAYVEHNSTRKIGERTESFYACEKYFREKWKEYLPIATCTIIT